ncbi:hypothetical protein COO60DRAFT_1459144 [Scenedesmus sp. NREL 46B-D3]|nr:hypothetical protein COO60DRAFT_1459144 [Scenedesmus sp. NREL 46B-D3]
MTIYEDLPSYTGRHLLQSPRVLGVGAGVFLLAFFLVVCVVLGLLGSRTTKPGLAYAASAAIYAIVALVLLASPKGYAPPPSPVGYDQTIIPLVVVMVLVSVGALGSLAGLLVFHQQPCAGQRLTAYTLPPHCVSVDLAFASGAHAGTCVLPSSDEASFLERWSVHGVIPFDVVCLGSATMWLLTLGIANEQVYKGLPAGCSLWLPVTSTYIVLPCVGEHPLDYKFNGKRGVAGTSPPQTVLVAELLLCFR